MIEEKTVSKRLKNDFRAERNRNFLRQYEIGFFLIFERRTTNLVLGWSLT